MAVIPKACLRCRALTTDGSYCRAHRPRSPSSRRLTANARPWRRLRAQVMARDRLTCQACGRPAVEVDHVVPVAEGGTDHPSNLRAICGRCNRTR